MKAQFPKGLLGVLLLVFIIGSNGYSLRVKREAKRVLKTSLSYANKPQKVSTTSDGTIKISALKPCISKAFCEVNSITKEPTYGASKEFYAILNRLKRYTDEEEQDRGNLSGSGSAEDDEASSEESSYERHPPGPGRRPQGPGRSGYPYPGFRRGKALKNANATATSAEDKLAKKKHKKKLKNKHGLKNTDVNDTSISDLDLEIFRNSSASSSNKSRSGRIEDGEEHLFIMRKTRELNVAEDLAALIKISAEIGQTLQSPRRCRDLFQKCHMSYQEIIDIFNKTQRIGPKPISDAPTEPETQTTLETQPEQDNPISDVQTPEKPSKIPLTLNFSSLEKESSGSGESNRKQKSRHAFSDEDTDIEYMTDTEIQQPVQTYTLFTPQEHRDTRHPEEILVEEAFKKFDNTFPVSGVPENLDFLKFKNSQSRQVPRRPSSSEEEERSAESGSQERPLPPTAYSHRSSETDDEEGNSGETQKVSPQHLRHVDDAGADFDVDDAPVETPGDKHWDKKNEAEEGEDEDESAEDDDNNEASEEDAEQGDITSDDAVKPQVEEEEEVEEEDEEKPLKTKKKKGSEHVNQLQGQKEESEEDEEPEQEPPPQDSPFYHYLQQINDGKGADSIPDMKKQAKKAKKGKKGSKKASKSKKHAADSVEDSEEDDEGPPQGQGHRRPPGQKGGGQGRPQDYQGGGSPQGYQSGGQGGQGYSGEGQQGDYPIGPQPSFFQSIMSWLPFGTGKQNSQEAGAQSYESYGQKPQSHKELPTYDDYKPSKGHPSSSSSSEYPQQDGHASSKRKPGLRYPSKKHKQGRGDESSEEDSSGEPQSDENVSEDREVQTSPSNKNKKRNAVGGGPKKRAPPPPLVIVPEVDESLIPVIEGDGRPAPADKTKVAQKSVVNKKNKEKDHSEEESQEGYSSEEITKKSPQPPSNSKPQTPKTQPQSAPSGLIDPVPTYATYFNKIFGQKGQGQGPSTNRRPSPASAENTSLLLTEFDKITSSFSTSADKVTDWSEEDNPKKKVNVASLATPGKNKLGKYTVKRNKPKKADKPTPQQQASFEDNQDDKNTNNSSEEEEDKRK